MRRFWHNTAFFTPTFVGVLVFALFVANANRIVYGLAVGDVAVGGYTFPEAQALLAERSAAFLDTPILLRYGDFHTEQTPRQLGLVIDQEATLAQAWGNGRNGNVLPNLFIQVVSLVGNKTLWPSIRLDDETYQPALHRALASIDEPAQNATLVWDPGRKVFRGISEHKGMVVDREALRSAILENAKTLTSAPEIFLTLVPDYPLTTTKSLAEASARVNAILAQTPLTLHAGSDTAYLTRDALARWFVFIAHRENEQEWLEVALVPEMMRHYLEGEAAPKINRDPVNATFTFENGRVTTFALARTGQQLDIEQSLLTLHDAILSSETIPQPITLAVQTTQPEIGNNAASELGIKDLLAVGETDFKGSPKNRMHNISIGASRFNGVLIKPGEEFSFNRFLGPVGPETGYKPELVIKQDKTVPEYGGGLCQVSTTAFRAAVYSGLQITERRNHAYVVRYYNPPGFDATIYPPRPDLRFINDTPGHILIQTSVKGTKLRFEFYGTNDGRKVDVIGPRVYDQKADGSAKATLTTRVTGPDGTIREQTFKSVYKSPALYPVSRRNPLE